MRSPLIETMCLPPIPVMRTIVRHSRLILEAHENYQKRSFRNRIYLNSAQGPTLFTIPLVKGKNEQTNIKNVQIANEEPWSTQFLKLLRSSYGSAPYFDYLFDDIKEILSRHWSNLWDLNLCFYEMIFKHLRQEVEFELTEHYQISPSSAHLDLRNKYVPNAAFFKNQDIRSYPQIFMYKHGHIPNLSILDLLMCCGPETMTYLVQDP